MPISFEKPDGSFKKIILVGEPLVRFRLNAEYLDEDAEILFGVYAPTPRFESFKWDTQGDKFYLSADLGINGNAFLNVDFLSQDVELNFGVALPSPRFESLKWNVVDGMFEFSEAINVLGNVIADGLYSRDGLGLNYDQSDENANIFFYKPTSGYEIFKWDKTEGRFDLSNGIIVHGYIKSTSDIYLRNLGPDGDSYVYFYDGTEGGAYLEFSFGWQKFFVNHTFRIDPGGIECTGDIDAGGYIVATGSLRSRGYILVNSDYASGDEDAQILFNGTFATHEAEMRWDHGLGGFAFTKKLFVLDSEINIGDGTTGANKSIFVYNGDANKPGLRFNETSNKWEYSNDGTTWSEMGSGTGGAVDNKYVTYDGVEYEAKWVEINATTNGDTTVVTGVSGKKIHVVAIDFVCSATVDVAWKSASTVKKNAQSFASKGGMVHMLESGCFVETAASEALVVNLSAVANVRGSLIYIEI